MAKKRAKYKGTQAILYLIVDIVCGLTSKRLGDFSKLKKKYTQAYLDDIMKSLATAQAMPNNSVRKAQQGSKGKTLKALNKTLCSLFQTLLLYIEDGFEENEQANMRKLAGSDYYSAAKGENWKDAKTMLEMAMAFMEEHPTELANGGMPADFVTDFGTENTAFVAALLAFSTGKNTTGEGTSVKVDANNALYVRIQSLMKDGRRIYEGNSALQKQFSYAEQRRLLGGDGKTGFRFWLLEADTLVPVEEASIRFLPSGLVFDEISEAGIMLVHLPELKDKAAYSYVLTAPGYVEMTGTEVADTGVMHRVNLILKKTVMVVDKDERVG